MFAHTCAFWSVYIYIRYICIYYIVYICLFSYIYIFIYLFFYLFYIFHFVLANNNFAPSNALQSLQVWVHVIYHPHIQNNIVQLVQVHPYLHLRRGHNNHDIFQLFGYLGNQWVNIILRVLCLQPALFCQRTQDSPSLCPTTGLTILASDVWAKQSMISICICCMAVPQLFQNIWNIWNAFNLSCDFPGWIFQPYPLGRYFLVGYIGYCGQLVLKSVADQRNILILRVSHVGHGQSDWGDPWGCWDHRDRWDNQWGWWGQVFWVSERGQSQWTWVVSGAIAGRMPIDPIDPPVCKFQPSVTDVKICKRCKDCKGTSRLLQLIKINQVCDCSHAICF